ncbi:disease resistance protein, partial [Tanacetum coccineum]
MADPITSALVSDLVGRFTTAAIQEKKTTQNTVEEWLKTLKSTYLEVENVIDEASTEAMIQSLPNIKHKARTFFSSHHNSLLVKTRIVHKVKNIRKKLEVIDANRSRFHLTSNIVYAIWGMGGIKKTTLAQYAYNHETVKTHFELKYYVYVSAMFDIKRIIKQIIKAIYGLEDMKFEVKIKIQNKLDAMSFDDLQTQLQNKLDAMSLDDLQTQLQNKLDAMSLDDLQKQLQNKLKGKKYFIIMDDVWIENKNIEKWGELCKALSCGAKGSMVMVTTWKEDIAQLMAKIAELQHNVGVLSEKESWSLFEMLAFPGRGEGEIEKEIVGREIVKRYKGLPLAVKTLGSLMSTKK